MPDPRHGHRIADDCSWCGCIGYHAEVCEGFSVNDPANSDPAHARDSLAHASRPLRPGHLSDLEVRE